VTDTDDGSAPITLRGAVEIFWPEACRHAALANENEDDDPLVPAGLASSRLRKTGPAGLL